jgi:hypothetical protein
MGSRHGEILVATLVFPAEFPGSHLHFTRPRSPGIETSELGHWDKRFGILPRW